MIKVLLVDDDEDLAEMVSLMLQANGMQVTTKLSAASLFETIHAQPPDILLMDIYLGDNDGRELCKQLKRSIGYIGFPVILYSAGDIPVASVTACGADHFLPKPFEMEQLVNRIRECVREKNTK